MAYTTINKSTDYFNTKIYSGNSTTSTNITGVGFQPDLTWIKNRTGAFSNILTDAVRGANKQVFSDNTSAETTYAQELQGFISDGFTVGSDNDVNGSSYTYASWNWKANGAGSTNYDGSITSTVSANQTAGFSIVSYTGSTGNYQVGHGLSSAPKVVMVKTRDNARNWVVYHQGIGAGNWLYLNQNYAQSADVNYWNNTNPTNSVFSVSNTNYNENNGNGENYIAYCFAEKTGYSKFGSYTGNGQSGNSAPFIYTGFKPAFYIWKRIASADWFLLDNKRDAFNITEAGLKPNDSSAESIGNGYNGVDFLSNGVKIRQSNGDINASGGQYIYMAFGQSLVGSNNVPCTAR